MQTPELEILVNGDARRIPVGSTLADLIERLGLGTRRLAVAVNCDVVPRTGFAARALSAGDRVEILEAVGGG